jgi:hypothetical protein
MFLIFYFIGSFQIISHFHNILKTKSSKHIKFFTILVQILTLKHFFKNIGYACYASFIFECTHV